ncbi:MAG: radical SAM protein, partial [Deltaproteobacteria bacterium]|nr:radical SAM protein [Deltaproteobacteria bacterium]
FLIARGYNRRLEIMVSARVDTTHAPTLRRMREAGIRWICFGVESGNQQILDRMGKQIKIEQIRRAYAMARAAGLFVAGNFMIGHLGETWDTAMDTINLAYELDQDYASFAIAIPFPGTGLYDYCLANGIKLPSWGGFGSVNSPPIPLNPVLGVEDLMKLRAIAVQRFFARPPYFFRLLRRFRVVPVVADFARMFLAFMQERRARRF